MSSNKAEISGKLALRRSENVLMRGTPLSLRFSAYGVTLSGLAGGEYLPLPASKGPAFPFLLTLDGYPTPPADFAQGQRSSSRKQSNTRTKNFNSHSELVSLVFRNLKHLEIMIRDFPN
jgi:hypothetical protein